MGLRSKSAYTRITSHLKILIGGITVHVQEYQPNVARTGIGARNMNNEEIEIWGDVIKKLNPNAKLR